MIDLCRSYYCFFVRLFISRGCSNHVLFVVVVRLLISRGCVVFVFFFVICFLVFIHINCYCCCFFISGIFIVLSRGNLKYRITVLFWSLGEYLFLVGFVALLYFFIVFLRYKLSFL